MPALEVMTPKEIVSELDKHIIGQGDAKRAVAIALRNRWRRQRTPEEIREEIMPKNILMIGPTGVGKTEIARRLARLAKAPFVKVEATKFTEVGYVGRDVDSIVRDLADVAVKMQREIALEKVQSAAEEAAEELILDALLPSSRDLKKTFFDKTEEKDEKLAEEKENELSKTAVREIFRKKFRNDELNDKDIEIEVSASNVGIEIMAPPGMEEMTGQLQNIFQSLSSDKKKLKKMKVKDAFRVLKEEEAAKLINEEEIKLIALENLQQNGIVFIDEIDKVTRRENTSGADVSREGVQRDLLPLVEGCSISTKYGMVNTDHILFIASGAFHMAKPSDLIAELQGRLPIRVELNALTADDFVRILTEPNASLTEQYQALLATEGVDLVFTQDGIKKIAELAYQVNENTENIGARRLHTVLERLLEEISFSATEQSGETCLVNTTYVEKQLEDLVTNEDLSHFIL